MKKNNVKSQVAKATKRINVKNIQGQYESTYPVAQMTIVSDRPIQQGMKYRGTITVDDIEHGDSTFRTETTIHRECPERKYQTLAETEDGSLKLNAKRVRLLLEVPYAATDTGTDIAARFKPQTQALLSKLRKIAAYLTDEHARKIIEAQAEALAEAQRERNLEKILPASND